MRTKIGVEKQKEKWLNEKIDLIYRRIITHDESNAYSLKHIIKESIRTLIEEIESG